MVTLADRALATINDGLDELAADGVDPADSGEARRLAEGLEAVRRRLDSMGLELLRAIDQRGLHLADGHHSAKTMLRHVAALSPAEATTRARCADALDDLPELAARYAAGAVPTCSVRRVARAHANPRVRAALSAIDTELAGAAASWPVKQFEARLTDWVRLADADGTCDTNQRHHERRDARLVQQFDLSWEVSGGCGAYQGAELHDIFKAFIDAEWRTDWDKARVEHGDDATVADLARTDAQRRFDALFEIFQRAAGHPPAGAGVSITTDVVIDVATFERSLVALAGGEAAPADLLDPAYRCGTIDGAPLEPVEATAMALVGHVRRVVVDAAGVVVDLGRRSRLFSGSARLAAILGDDGCYWPGCHVPATACQVDHVDPWHDPGRGGDNGGSTSPANAGPLCGHHNRIKAQGYRAWRDADGTWIVHRPDGVQIE